MQYYAPETALTPEVMTAAKQDRQLADLLLASRDFSDLVGDPALDNPEWAQQTLNDLTQAIEERRKYVAEHGSVYLWTLGQRLWIETLEEMDHPNPKTEKK